MDQLWVPWRAARLSRGTALATTPSPASWVTRYFLVSSTSRSRTSTTTTTVLSTISGARAW